MTAETVDESGQGTRIPIGLALLPVALLIGLLSLNVWIFGADASYGANQIALIVAAALAAWIGRFFGASFQVTNQGILRSIGSATNAMLILLLIGGLTGTWLISGVVPAMIYYGLQILSPETFLIAAVLIASIVSVATGSSWTTVATVGVALLGIGDALGVPQPMIAGAIISGAYFGDKISPLSDTTNLASAMANVELFTHIRYMLWTTVPSLLITLGIFWLLGRGLDVTGATASADVLPALIDTYFNISPWLFVVPALVIVMVILRFHALVALFIAMMLGGLVALVAQPKIIEEIAQVIIVEGRGSDQEPGHRRGAHAAVTFGAAAARGDAPLEHMAAASRPLLRDNDSYARKAYVVLCRAISDKTEVPVQRDDLQDLFASRGMVGMLNTIWLILCAMCFGGAMEATGMLHAITAPLVRMAKSTGALIATTTGTCLFVNVTASDQYLAIVVPGRMFRQAYADRNLAPQNLSRTLEDSGTVTSVLVPWNTCGATQQGVLNVDVIQFAPYCFFCWISPLMTMLYGFLGIAIQKGTPEYSEADEANSRSK